MNRSSSSRTVTLEPVADTYVRSSDPETAARDGDDVRRLPRREQLLRRHRTGIRAPALQPLVASGRCERHRREARSHRRRWVRARRRSLPLRNPHLRQQLERVRHVGQPARRRHPARAARPVRRADDQRHPALRFGGRPRRSERLQLELLGASRPAGSNLRRTAGPPRLVRERGPRRDRRREPVAPDLGPAVRDADHGCVPDRPGCEGVLPPVPLPRGGARAPAEARRHARVCSRRAST